MAFDIRKYKNEDYDLIDGSDALANQGQVLSIRNERNGRDVYFKAFISAFNDTFSPNYTPTEVFGRTDPIYQYKNTTRSITLAWKIPAASEGEAFENLSKVQKFLQMLYPSYTDANDALTLSETPLVRIKVMNLLQKVSTNKVDNIVTSGPRERSNKAFQQYITSQESSRGLLGVITSCTVNYNLEGADGVFEKTMESGGAGGSIGKKGTILPKLIDINISFSPLHEKTLGYGSGSSVSGFPYGLSSTGNDISDEASDFALSFARDGRINKDLYRDPQQEEDLTEAARAARRAATPAGKSLSELREIKETLEGKRRAASAAQQKLDKAQAAARRAYRKLGSGRELNDRDRAKLDAVVEAFRDNLEPQEELQGIEDLLG